MDFSDIKDFTSLPPGAFEEINFCNHTNLLHMDEEEESQTEDNDESYCVESNSRDHNHITNRILGFKEQEEFSRASLV